ncbi:hypothetical protein BKA56DRAFT_718963 [Ilyonectria sp. MPI-CAGE-AT-0026]|nr:hypothetical protein BKA56DRAFT_718963 [Ilyonectria sp. MPI-CAGE-AT-0026]
MTGFKLPAEDDGAGCSSSAGPELTDQHTNTSSPPTTQDSSSTHYEQQESPCPGMPPSRKLSSVPGLSSKARRLLSTQWNVRCIKTPRPARNIPTFSQNNTTCIPSCTIFKRNCVAVIFVSIGYMALVGLLPHPSVEDPSPVKVKLLSRLGQVTADYMYKQYAYLVGSAVKTESDQIWLRELLNWSCHHYAMATTSPSLTPLGDLSSNIQLFEMLYEICQNALDLESALRRAPQLRNLHPGPDSTFLLWEDAICINQGNAPERTAQLSLMAKLYQNAECVFVWLGSEDKHDAFRALRPVINEINNIAEQSDTEEGMLGILSKWEWLSAYPNLSRNDTLVSRNPDIENIPTLLNAAWSAIKDLISCHPICPSLSPRPPL